MKNMMEKTLQFGFGLAALTRERAEKIVNEAVEKGEVEKNQAQGFVKDLLEKGEKERDELRNLVKKEISEMLKDFNVAEREYVEQLEKRIAELEQKSGN